MTEFTIGTTKPKRLSKKEKVKRLSKKPVYSATVSNEYNIPTYFPVRYTLPRGFSLQKKDIWRIPQTIHVSPSVETKFGVLSCVFSYRVVINYIKDSLARIRFKFPYEKDTFEVPQEIRAQITSYYAKQENEWNKVRGIYFKLFRFRQSIMPLIYNWKVKIARRNIKNMEDPVTLELPRMPVYLIDIKKKMSFVYDARSIRRAIEGRLLFSDYMFAEPLEPVNLLTNEPLTYGQLISIIRQCRAYGEASWILDELQIHGANLKRFAIFNKQRLNLEAINVFFKKSTHIMRETVVDFFIQEADMADLPRYKITGFIRRYDTEPTNGLVQKWIRNTKEYYIAKELNNSGLLFKNEEDTEKLLNSIHLSIF